jgi:hypothetical protein
MIHEIFGERYKTRYNQVLLNALEEIVLWQVRKVGDRGTGTKKR